MLLWYEPFALVTDAIRRENALERWNRAWKMQLIEQHNPDWIDPCPSLVGAAPDPRGEPQQGGGMKAFLKRIVADGDR